MVRAGLHGSAGRAQWPERLSAQGSSARSCGHRGRVRRHVRPAPLLLPAALAALDRVHPGFRPAAAGRRSAPACHPLRRVPTVSERSTPSQRPASRSGTQARWRHQAAAGHHRKGSGRSERRQPLAFTFFVCSHAPMSHPGRIDRDLVIPPRPTRTSMAGRAWPVPTGAARRVVAAAAGAGGLQRRFRRALLGLRDRGGRPPAVGLMASRSGADGRPRRGGPTKSSGTC
jgi:hypothetical protein